MIEHIPPFLQRLALGLDADTRAIRRAYARELKLIDQEADLPGFQSLRDMYESALAWAARQERQREEPALASPAMPGANDSGAAREQALPGAAPNALADAGALADAAFARLALNAKLLAEEGVLDDVARWEAELKTRLADDELFNITARNLFEERIAHLLFSGEIAGRGCLFDAAAAVFQWAHERRRLKVFGHAGAFLDRVIDERSMFEGQETAELNRQRNVLQRLRKADAPTRLQLRRDMFYVERMVERFPNFMAVMVSSHVVLRWRAMSGDVNGATAPVPDVMPEPVLHGHSTKRGFDKAWIFLLILAIGQLARMFGDATPSPSHTYDMPVLDTASEPSYAPGVAPGKRKGEPGYGQAPEQFQAPPFAMPAGAPLSRQGMLEAVMDAIENDIAYQPTAGTPKGVRSVVYVVLSTSGGEIYGVNVIKRSTDLAFDEAVKAAILRAKALPPGLRGNLQMQFTYAPSKRAPKGKA